MRTLGDLWAYATAPLRTACVSWAAIFGVLLLLALSGGLVLLFFGLFHLFRVLMPVVLEAPDERISDARRNVRRKRKNRALPPDPSVQFFDHMALFEAYDRYEAAVKTTDVLEDVLRQIYAASRVCQVKFYHQAIGVRWSLIGVLLFGLSFALGCLAYSL